MANKGLRSGTKQLERSVDGSFDTYVNLSKQDANLVTIIPFININARYIFDINLIYNHQNMNVNDGLLGYGFRFSFYTKVDYVSSTRYQITNADGSIDYYDYNSSIGRYKNNKTLKEILVSGSQGSRIYNIYDKYGNIVEVKENISNPYPSKITYVDGKEITFIYYQNPYKLYRIQLGSFITIDFYGTPINQVEYNYEGYVSTYTLHYTNSKLDQFNNALTKNGVIVNSSTKRIDIEYDSTSSICFIDSLKKEKIKFEFSNGYVFLVKEYKYAISESYTYSTINYINNNKTTVTNFYGDSVNYYFNNDGIPLYEKDNNDNIIFYNHNDNDLLTHLSSNISAYPRKSGYLDSNIGSFTNSGLSISTYQTSSDEFSNILGSSIYRLTGTGSIYKDIYRNFIMGDTLTLVVFAKSLNTGSLSVTLSYNGINKTVYSRVNHTYSYYEAIVVGIKLTSSTNQIRVTLTLNSKDVAVGGLELLKKDFGTYYEYNSNNDVIEVLNQNGKTLYTYNSNKLVSTVENPDGLITTYQYDNTSNYKVSSATTNYGNKIKYEYTLQNYNVSKTRIVTSSNDSVGIEESQTYESDMLVTSKTNDLGKTTTISYNNKGLTDKVTNPDGSIIGYEYDSDNYITKLRRKKENINGVYADYSYTKPLFKNVNPSNDSLKQINYTANNDIDTFTNNGNIVIDRNYNNKDLLTKNKFGVNADSFNFTYDSEYKLTNISYQHQNNGTLVNKYTFTYNNFKELSNVTYSNNTTKNYTYDSNDNLIKIDDNNTFEYHYRYNNDNDLSVKRIKTNNYNKYYAYGNDKVNIVEKIYGNTQNLNGFDIYPFQNGVVSLNGYTPEIYNSSSIYKFTYDSDMNTMCVSLVTTKFVNDFDLSGAGTLMMRMKIYSTYGKQYVYKNVDGSNYLGLYLYNGYLYIETNVSDISTNVYVSTNTWHTIGFSFDMTIVGNSASSSSVIVRIYLDGSSYEYQVNGLWEQLTTYLGRDEYDNYVLSGYVYNLAYKSAYSNVTTLNQLNSELCNVNISKNIDLYGRISENKIRITSSNSYDKVLKHEYSYKTRSNTNYLSKLVGNETITYGSNYFVRGYTYDDMGRVTFITNSSNLFGSHSYEYDYRGFLTSESFNGNNVSYMYNDNGNIILAGNTSFSYDSIIKDRLVSVGGSNISYSSNNPLNPTSFEGWGYRYEGRRLVEAEKDNSYENIKITFTYDEEGNIIRRDYYYYSYEDEYEETRTTSYYYESGKLVTEVTPYVRNDYLYDSEGKLIGFIKNNTTKYFYITDILSNIIGIVDESGNIVTRYYSDAYGYNMIISGSTSIYNPFRYKGYYFDSDIEMYWCKSRFYVPYWHRWLNADSVEYLDINNVGCVNLFAYCNNNPVMFVDPEGDFAISIGIGITLSTYKIIMATIVIIAVVALVAAALSVENEYHIIEQGTRKIMDVFDNYIDETIQYIKKKAYERKKAAPRIKKKTKKEAKQAAFIKGGKKEPIFHNGKHGKHYHPNNPKFQHWHYYFTMIFGFDASENDEDMLNEYL